MKLFIISVGKTSEPALRALIEPYQKRLNSMGYHAELISIPSSAVSAPKKIQLESQAIIKRIPRSAVVVLFDEDGSPLSTKKLANELEKWQLSARPICLIIGGAFGVSNELKKIADFVFKLSDLTLPHQLVRLLIFEQLYRAADINNSGNYHHE